MEVSWPILWGGGGGGEAGAYRNLIALHMPFPPIAKNY